MSHIISKLNFWNETKRIKSRLFYDISDCSGVCASYVKKNNKNSRIEIVVCGTESEERDAHPTRIRCEFVRIKKLRTAQFLKERSRCPGDDTALDLELANDAALRSADGK